MVELVRTNDLVLISFVESVLTQAGVRFFVADNHMSAVEGSLGFLPRRILVDADQHAAGAPVDARGRPVARTQRWLKREATSLDAILGGRLRLRQTRDGHRVGLDAILLAAAAGRRRRGSSTSAPGSARSAWRCCSAGRRRRAS